MQIRNDILSYNNKTFEPLIYNINIQLKKNNKLPLQENDNLYKNICKYINDTNVFENILNKISKDILTLNNSIYKENFPDLFNDGQDKEKDNDKDNDEELSRLRYKNDNNDINKENDKNSEEDTSKDKKDDKDDENDKDKDKDENKELSRLRYKSDDNDINKENNKNIINEDENNISKDEKDKKDEKGDKNDKKNKGKGKELSRLRYKNNDKDKNDELESYTLDNYTFDQLAKLIKSYKSSFNIDSEIINAAIGHIESFNGESYKRIFDPLFQGEFKKQLPEIKSALSILDKVQLTTLIVNNRNRFAEFCRIFLYNISDNKHKFFLREINNLKSTFIKQLRYYLLHNQTIIKIINKRLYDAFQKYYNAFVNNVFDKNKYNQSFNNLSFANEIKDVKGSVNQFKDCINKAKVLIANDKSYVFNMNKSFEDCLYELNLQDALYNYAQGYIIKNCVFLEPLVNCSEEEAVNILLNDMQNIKKIYLTINKENDILTERRLAKLIRG